MTVWSLIAVISVFIGGAFLSWLAIGLALGLFKKSK